MPWDYNIQKHHHWTCSVKLYSTQTHKLTRAYRDSSGCNKVKVGSSHLEHNATECATLCCCCCGFQKPKLLMSSNNSWIASPRSLKLPSPPPIHTWTGIEQHSTSPSSEAGFQWPWLVPSLQTSAFYKFNSKPWTPSIANAVGATICLASAACRKCHWLAMERASILNF